VSRAPPAREEEEEKKNEKSDFFFSLFVIIIQSKVKKKAKPKNKNKGRMSNCFVYGTLMAEEVLQCLIKRVPKQRPGARFWSEGEGRGEV
jgi:hypothetical protein